ncbi:aldehyde dehydrogenase family protein [Mycobacterium sp. CBMA293]|uniref:aldehyde dehydrogenase family protein n=1 Tax=unclassified Mycolicibacterium TaxID=2636767 RepID=UPI0012DDA1FC|nr:MULTISPECIES: aldehyde dehydrogenase family protein [unclassified Mycolicibacterium]MUL49850.1 aldehyde dehydrogenase family protein [Mycolicibacterium sp. CBMA 360]MUL61516.1 aldehyde dehydrogenase family protein [Mycolicibacterium sp. CBMA 335]MUL74251.1 aldehyde dehydrogenase family protein [Mycolicibacterium sp. CBMA 311]MUL97123.1 aldehyde dehydrogenase family protein [Mycolicibacterium sp. CBMA 230]MUM08183.1 aldehyde dehydrogenase family protein [Mycolicibacterium sp. CBMA 213]
MIDATEQGAAVVAELREIFATGRTRDLSWRLEQLRGIERLCNEREHEIVDALAADLGRPAFDGWLADIASTKAEAAYARKHLKKWMRRRRVGLPLSQQPARGWVQYDPLGVVLVIGPWNYPFYLSVGPLVAAVAAGNCVVVKPSELAPATSAVLAQLLPQYLDPQAIRVVEGDGATTQALLAQGFDHALFTGGTEVGKKIMAGAAPTLTPVTLELGGKSPVIVTADADIDVAARRIAWVKLLNSGQTCIAPDYVLVERPIADKLVAKIIENVERFRSAEANKSLRIVNDRQFDRLAGLIGSTTGTVVMGGGADRSTLHMEPTVIVNPAADDPVMTEEIFGPILPVVRVGSVDAAVRYINAKPKPLALYVFTESTALAHQIIDAVPSGGAVVNHIAMHVMVPQLPFGGVGASGMGAYHGRWGFEAMSHRRAVLAKRSKPDPKMFYPPYSRLSMKLMRKLF